MRRPALLTACLALLAAPVCVASGALSGASGSICTKDTSYRAPGGLTLSTDRPGLAQAVDPVHTYRVYGDTAAEIRAQMSRCAPSLNDGYPAYTRDWLNYRYLSTVQPDGTCKVEGVAVGLHAGTVLPAWKPGPNAAPGLAGRWKSYITALAAHEHGHVVLALKWAKRLLADLQGLPALACGTVTARTAATFTTDNHALDRANIDYDARTGHGATQGAVL